MAISFAKEILKIIPGRVSIEINAKYAFDSQSTEYEASKILDLCCKRNLDTKITNEIWKSMIRAYIKYEFRNFRK